MNRSCSCLFPLPSQFDRGNKEENTFLFWLGSADFSFSFRPKSSEPISRLSDFPSLFQLQNRETYESPTSMSINKTRLFLPPTKIFFPPSSQKLLSQKSSHPREGRKRNAQNGTDGGEKVLFPNPSMCFVFHLLWSVRPIFCPPRPPSEAAICSLRLLRRRRMGPSP